MLKRDNDEGEEDYFIVEKILDKKKISGRWKYQVQWDGYPDAKDFTWEPLENLENVQNLVEDFEKNWKEKNGSLLKKKTNREGKNRSTNKDDKSDDISNMMPEDLNYNDLTFTNSLRSIKKEAEKQFLKDKEGETISVIESSTKDALNSPMSEGTQNKNGGKINLPEGSFETDKAHKIINAKIINDNDLELNCLIQWAIRQNGIRASNSWYSSKYIRKRDPEILIDFYEARVKLPSKPIHTDGKSNLS
jgi:hypothetical protein